MEMSYQNLFSWWFYLFNSPNIHCRSQLRPCRSTAWIHPSFTKSAKGETCHPDRTLYEDYNNGNGHVIAVRLTYRLNSMTQIRVSGLAQHVLAYGLMHCQDLTKGWITKQIPCCLTTPTHYPNVDLSLVRSNAIHLGPISHEVLQPSITKISLKITSKISFKSLRVQWIKVSFWRID